MPTWKPPKKEKLSLLPLPVSIRKGGGWAEQQIPLGVKLFCIVFIVFDRGFHFKTDLKETVSTAAAFIVLSLTFCY